MEVLNHLRDYKIIEAYINNEASLVDISKKHSISIRTLSRWIKIYKENGLDALTRKKRIDKDERRKIPTNIKNLIEGLALNKSKSIATIHRQACQAAQKLKVLEPTYSITYNIIKNIPKSIITLAHSGNKAYEQKFDLLCTNIIKRPNEVWQSDHCLLDINLDIRM